MDLSQITPLILTYNEAANIGDTLSRLPWATRVVLVDSGSTDETLEICRRSSCVDVVHRKFDHFADQCNFGLQQITTEWVLSLDADYKCPAGFPQELEALNPVHEAGFRAHFTYGVYGRPLRSTLYPPRTVLYRRQAAAYERDGHAHRVRIAGPVGTLRSKIMHDDWKTLDRWYEAQLRYAALEAEKLGRATYRTLDWKDRIRCWPGLAAALTLPYCLFYKRLILDGRPGLFYTMQRVFAEWLLSMKFLDVKLRSTQDP